MITNEEKLLVLLKWSEYIHKDEITDWVMSYEIHQPNMTFIDFVDSVMTAPIQEEHGEE